MTQNDTSCRISVFWAPWEYAIQMFLLPFSIYRTMYDIKTVIASFLRKLQQNFAQSQYFPIHTTKRAVLGFLSISAQLWLAKNSQIPPT
jgi:hypothetical protein